MRDLLDEYLLELILMDSLVFSSSRCIPGAERVIQSFIPPGFYDRIIARYDAVSDDWDDAEARVPVSWLGRAASQSSAWKRMMIERFLQIICLGGGISHQELREVAALAHSMGAEQECRQVCSRFGGSGEGVLIQ